MGCYHFQEDPMTAVASEGVAATRHRLRRRLRATVLGPRGGLGVVEAGLIAGLTSAGIPQDQAVAAVLIERFFTAYLPPIWGFLTLTWMRRREYV